MNSNKTEEVPMYEIVDSKKVYNLCVDAANSDPIRAARLKQSDDPGDKERLKDLEETPMMRLRQK